MGGIERERVLWEYSVWIREHDCVNRGSLTVDVRDLVQVELRHTVGLHGRGIVPLADRRPGVQRLLQTTRQHFHEAVRVSVVVDGAGK